MSGWLSAISLRWRIAASLALVAAALAAGAIAAAGVTAGRELREETDDFLLDRVDDIRNLGRPGRQESDFGRRPFGGIADPDAVTQLVTDEGIVIGTLGPTGLELPVDVGLIERLGRRPVLSDVTVEGRDFRMVTASAGSGLVVQVARATEENQRVIADLRHRLIIIGLIGVAAAGLVGWLVAARIVAPVQRLTASARRVAEQGLGGPPEPIPVTGGDEVASLADSFNRMLAALTSSQEQQHRLVRDASHELRTPLTSLRTNIDLLARGDRLSDTDRRELIDDVRSELGELTALVTELVELATDSATDEASQPVRPVETAARVVERARRRSGRPIELIAGDEAVIEVRPHAYERAVTNLVTNAVVHTPAGTPIEVRVEGGGVTVHDAGPGIPPDQRELVFERFHRTDEARSRPGSGLGLAIVAAVAESHGGRAMVTDSDMGGAAVSIELPAVEPG